MRPFRETRFGILTVMVLGCWLWAGAIQPAHSQYNWRVVKEPTYNPHTKSYFELRRVPNPAMQGTRWEEAANRATKLTYKGVNGRLAIVRDLQTHEFLLKFPIPKQTWIGLRLDCSTRELKWVDGSTLEKDGFNAWTLGQWYLTDGITCSEQKNMPHMGVFYDSKEKFRWKAAGRKKAFDFFLIEYPTGGR